MADNFPAQWKVALGEKKSAEKDAFQKEEFRSGGVKVEVAGLGFPPLPALLVVSVDVTEAATLNHAHAALVTVDPNMSTDIRGHD